jgi:pimeloyl-ACP methyl ester carboxylesterase
VADGTATYRPRRIPRRETVRLRGLDIHLRRWGPAAARSNPSVVLLHGLHDTGDTFQFMVDEMARDWPLLALDWRGFGRSGWPQEGYWFQDYFADLEALLEHESPDAPVALVGHSMGGNIANIYAGLRPQRIRCVANLESFGLPRSTAEKAPAQMRKWLDQVKAAPPAKDYDSFEQLAAVIRFRYPRITEIQAAFIAATWGTSESGRVRLRGDPRHRWANPVRYHREDAEACWRETKAPVLLLLGEESELLPTVGEDAGEAPLRRFIPQLEIQRIAGAGHMLHIEQAEQVARAVEGFLEAHGVADQVP